jgi:hypothetical protein
VRVAQRELRIPRDKRNELLGDVADMRFSSGRGYAGDLAYGLDQYIGVERLGHSGRDL